MILWTIGPVDVCLNVVLESYEKEQAMNNVENIDEHRNAYK